MTTFYTQHNPEKLDPDNIDKLIKKYIDNPELLFKRLAKRYPPRGQEMTRKNQFNFISKKRKSKKRKSKKRKSKKRKSKRENLQRKRENPKVENQKRKVENQKRKRENQKRKVENFNF